jgi:tRNA pseudouridine32 synthase/23S rRNA pseudouridine746 synthase
MVRSRTYLPKLDSPPATILEHLIFRFPHVSESAWRSRMARGLVTTEKGEKIVEDSHYAAGLVFYAKEIPYEPAPTETEIILFQDGELLVADKPHGMPVTPAGSHVARSLLNRLQESTGIDTLVPLHRVDRDTAGIVLFGINAESRALYHALFATRSIAREYLAVARVARTPDQTHWLVENRLQPGTPWFRQEIAEGPINSITRIELVTVVDGLGLFHLRPETGKKHQLRVHMASLGFPILGDSFYSESPDSPVLQLLAYKLQFVDPLTGVERVFRSTRKLQYAVPGL